MQIAVLMIINPLYPTSPEQDSQVRTAPTPPDFGSHWDILCFSTTEGIVMGYIMVLLPSPTAQVWHHTHPLMWLPIKLGFNELSMPPKRVLEMRGLKSCPDIHSVPGHLLQISPVSTPTIP